MSTEQNNDKAINNYLADIQQAGSASNITVLDSQGAVIGNVTGEPRPHIFGQRHRLGLISNALLLAKRWHILRGMRTKERGVTSHRNL
ncbi:hypothetical protein ACOBV9_20325 (plasmid) [Pseudoalteromonas espejiana]